MSEVSVEAFNRRSFVYRQLQEPGWIEREGGALATRLAPERDAVAPACRLVDLSVLPRRGWRGPAADKLLAQLGLTPPATANQMRHATSGAMLLRLGANEYWLLDNPMAARSDPLLRACADAGSGESACYPLYCQDSHAWLLLVGDHLAEVMAKVCGVDLSTRVFPPGAIAQTSVARVNAIIVSHEVNGVAAFSILSDSASAEYLWRALLDAAAEFGGIAAGVETLGYPLGGTSSSGL